MLVSTENRNYQYGRTKSCTGGTFLIWRGANFDETTPSKLSMIVKSTHVLLQTIGSMVYGSSRVENVIV